jgi:transposase InsO family protein
VLQRAVIWFAAHGVTVECVLSDNGACYRSHAWKDACATLGITHKRTRPYRPQTNGKSERFHRTLADGWAYARFYTSDLERRAALPGWLHFYNHHRIHSAIGDTIQQAQQPAWTSQLAVPVLWLARIRQTMWGTSSQARGPLDRKIATDHG